MPEAHAAVEMATAIAGGRNALRARPPLSIMQCTAPPLGHDGGSLDTALIVAEAGIPVGFMTMTACLTTAPATLAGNLAVGNAEVISAAALIQLAHPGAPFFYAAAQTSSDLRSGGYTGGGPEDYLFGAATNVLADFYNMPLSMGSFATGAKEPNWQAGVDNSLSTFMASIVMSDMLLGVGFLHGSRIWSFEQMLMDSEIFDIVHQMMKGIDVDDETLALDAIRAVGPGGNFLTQKHTRKHMRELFLPKFMDRRTYDAWEDRPATARATGRAPRPSASWPPTSPSRSTQRCLRSLAASSPAPRRRSSMQPKMELLTPDLIDRILGEAFELLATTGVKVLLPEARDLLIAAGARADESGEVVRIPETVARKALETVPHEFWLHTRSGEPTVRYGGDAVAFRPRLGGRQCPRR